MRVAMALLVSLLVTGTVGAADPARVNRVVRVAQLAPDGFPLRFPLEAFAAPLGPQFPPPSAEELPLPGTRVPQTYPTGPVLVPPPASLPVAPVRYPTHREFAATFRPVPGNYEVMMIHPFTQRPVKVCFSLPPGYIREVDADRSELRFDYGKWELEVHFKRDGRVLLDIDD